MFARESTHRGSVWCRSTASSQVRFLLEVSLTYHCACRLRLAERCIFHLPAVEYALLFLCFSGRCTWLLAVTSELCLVFTRCVCSLALCPQSLSSSTCYVWMRRCCFGVCAPTLPCEALLPQPCGHHSRGEALFPRASGRHSARSRWSRAS